MIDQRQIQNYIPGTFPIYLDVSNEKHSKSTIFVHYYLAPSKRQFLLTHHAYACLKIFCLKF
jgi:hypothetical protein